jgi:Protein of unknown function (DUF3738)
MRTRLTMFIFSLVAFAQRATFEVASVKCNPRTVGPDYNNQLTISPSRFVGRNLTLRRLVAEAYGVQMTQVAGPRWFDENEYDLDARGRRSRSPPSDRQSRPRGVAAPLAFGGELYSGPRPTPARCDPNFRLYARA